MFILGRRGLKKMNKKYIGFSLVAVFALVMVSAAVVTYYSQVQIDMSIESPVGFTGELSVDVPLIAGNGYNLYLIEGENSLGVDIPVEFMFSLLDGEGDVITDTTGFHLAYSDDIQYAYNPEYGGVNNWVDAQAWMNDNLDWFDWYLTSALIEYDATVITNDGGNSAHEVLSFNTAITEDLSPGEFKAVMYLDIDEAVLPGTYTLSVDMMPAAE